VIVRGAVELDTETPCELAPGTVLE
jgi:hypothetical protein